MKCDAEFDYKTTWQLTLHFHGNCLHFKMLKLASETSILLHVNCQNKLPLLDDTVLRYAV